MRDDYGDFKVEDSIPEELVAEEPKDERLEDIGFNVIKIHGEDFVLKPLGE
jgi:transketolase N-terminal domain/subunit